MNSTVAVPWWLYMIGVMVAVAVFGAFAVIALFVAAVLIAAALIVCGLAWAADKIVNRGDPGGLEAAAELAEISRERLDAMEDNWADEIRVRDTLHPRRWPAATNPQLHGVVAVWPARPGVSEAPTLEFPIHPDQERMVFDED